MFLNSDIRSRLFSGLRPNAALFVTASAVLLHMVFGWDLALMIARVGFCWMCLAAMPRFELREWALAVLSLGLALTLVVQPGGMARLFSALDLAAFFATFIVLLTLIKEAAERSPSVKAVGHFLTSQPAGRRFFATALGGHTLGVFLNFGAVSLIAPLIQKGAEDSSGRVDPDTERRQLSALLRGFSWFLLWAPTSLAQAVLLILFPGVDYVYLVSMGLLTAAVMIVLGRAMDRFEWRHAPPLPVAPAPVVPKRAFAVVASVCGLLIALTFSLSLTAGFTIAQSLMIVAPTITCAWFIAEGAPFNGLGAISRRTKAFGAVLTLAAPALIRTGVTLGLSGFIGRAAASVLPTDQIAQWLDLSSVPTWLFLAALPVIITAGGQIALSPILMVVFFGELLGQMPALPADPTLIVYSLAFGWALSMSASPNATATLLISATCRIPPQTLTWKWNGAYAVLCYAAFLGIIGILA